MLKTKRVYVPPSPDDGVRILVDRIWPRGIRKEKLQMEAWYRDIAPSDGLRKWFSHDPEKWEEFKKRFFKEVNGKDEFKKLVGIVREKSSEAGGNVTLLFSSREEVYNNASALKEFIEKELRAK